MTWAIVLAAGAGQRFGGAKADAVLGGRRLVDRAVAAVSACAGVVVVLPHGRPWDGPSVAAAVAGGATRAASVRAGLGVVPRGADVVVVHDAAHPLATPALVAAVVAAVRDGADAAAPGVVPVDAVVRRGSGGRVEHLGRDELCLLQCPMAFRTEVLRAAHSARPVDAVEDTALVVAAGGTLVVVDGDAANVHVATPLDLAVAGALLDARGLE